MPRLKCPHCNHTVDYDVSEIKNDSHGTFVECRICTKIFDILTEMAVIENKEKTHSKAPSSVLEKGRIVVIVNEEHPWYNDFAIIREIKHKHYRIELHGKKLWVPFEWVRPSNELT